MVAAEVGHFFSEKNDVDDNFKLDRVGYYRTLFVPRERMLAVLVTTIFRYPFADGDI